MKRIEKTSFINAVKNVENQKHISTAQIANKSSYSRSYIYHLVSPKYSKSVRMSTARAFGKAMGLDEGQVKRWITQMSFYNKQNQSTINKFVHPIFNQDKHNHFTSKSQRKEKENKRLNYIKDRRLDYDKRKLIHTIRNIMSAKSISTQKLARKSGLNTKRVSELIHNNTPMVNPITIARIANGLNINAKKLLNISRHSRINNSKRNYLKKRTDYYIKPSAKELINHINHLSNADIAIVNAIVNRISEAEHKEKE